MGCTLAVGCVGYYGSWFVVGWDCIRGALQCSIAWPAVCSAGVHCLCSSEVQDAFRVGLYVVRMLGVAWFASLYIGSVSA